MAIKNIPLISTNETILFQNSNESTAILSMIFCNTTNSSLTVTSYAYPPSASAGSTDNMIINKLVIPKTETYVWTAEQKFVLGNGDKITAKLDAASSPGIAITITYYVIA